MINVGLFNLGALRKSSTGWRAAAHKEHIDNEDGCEQNRPGDCFVKVASRFCPWMLQMKSGSDGRKAGTQSELLAWDITHACY